MTYNKKSIEDIEIKAGQKVFVRCDFNVPMKDGVITSDKRIVGALPTIKYLIEKGAKPEDAITATANSLAQKRAGVPPEPEIPGLIPEGSVEPIGSVAGLM